MTGLDIRPHSRRLSALAVTGLGALAVGGFASGFGRQIAESMEPSPFPPVQEALGVPVADDAPPAPAPALPARRAQQPPTEDAAPAAVTPPAADASAVVPELPAESQPPAAAEPESAPPPAATPTADPPTP